MLPNPVKLTIMALQRTASQYDNPATILQDSATTLQQTAMRCNTLQHAATHYDKISDIGGRGVVREAVLLSHWLHLRICVHMHTCKLVRVDTYVRECKHASSWVHSCVARVVLLPWWLYLNMVHVTSWNVSVYVRVCECAKQSLSPHVWICVYMHTDCECIQMSWWVPLGVMHKAVFLPQWLQLNIVPVRLWVYIYMRVCECM